MSWAQILDHVGVTTAPRKSQAEMDEEYRERLAESDRRKRKIVPLNKAGPSFDPSATENQLHSIRYRIGVLKGTISERNQRHQERLATIQEQHNRESERDQQELTQALAEELDLKTKLVKWAVRLEIFEGLGRIDDAADDTPELPPALEAPQDDNTDRS